MCIHINNWRLVMFFGVHLLTFYILVIPSYPDTVLSRCRLFGVSALFCKFECYVVVVCFGTPPCVNDGRPLVVLQCCLAFSNYFIALRCTDAYL